MKNIDKATLSLAYTPGVGTICMDIFKDPQLVNKYTCRGRSIAIVTDGTLLDSSPKNFMPVMDWFVFQIKKYCGFDAYPFVLMKEANVSEVIKNLANTYSTIIYLDSKENNI
jgi:malate dehydrogenase (oxaloacetate-decarboxylating)